MQKEDRYFELIQHQQESGLSVREFCSNEGIAPSTFYYWSKKLKRQTGKRDFIPLIVNPDGRSLTAHGYRKEKHRLNPSGQSTADGFLLEVVYPNGTIIRAGKDLELAQLRALVHLLD